MKMEVQGETLCDCQTSITLFVFNLADLNTCVPVICSHGPPATGNSVDNVKVKTQHICTAILHPVRRL